MSFGGLQTCPAQAARSVVSVGSTVTLNCPSNDDNHIFKFWEFGSNQIIGPGNPYDERKYNYKVLSGNLTIKSFTPEESGCYNCFSEHISGSNRSVQSVQILTEALNTNSYPTAHMFEKIIYSPAHLDQQEADSSIDTVKLVAIIVSFIVIIACGVIYVLLRREWNKYDGRIVVPIDDDDEEEGDEIYNRTTTSINPGIGPSRNASSDQLYGIENQGLDTDFNSVFEQIQIKSPNHSLI